MIDPLLIDEKVQERFSKLIKNDRLAHAYLFVGSSGVGKTDSALAVAKLVNCERKLEEKDMSCGVCSSCIQVDSGNHPDIHLTGYRNLKIQLTTHAIGGLSENDFIVASKIDECSKKLKKG